MKNMLKIRVLMVGESPHLRGGIASVQKLILKNVPANISITHLATVDSYPSDPNLPKILVFIRALAKLLLYLVRKDIDIVHIHLSERGSAIRKMIVAALVILFHTPLIIHAHGSEFHLFYPKLPWIMRWVMRSVFSKCDRFVVLSNSWKSFYLEKLDFSPEQVVVLENPVVIPPQIPNCSTDSMVNLLFLGRVGERKGAYDLLKAFSALPSNLLESSKLLLAGDGEIDLAIRLSHELNISDRVTVLGWLDSNERNNLLSKVDVFILPSYNEGLPMALLEAMAYALPVITTPVGGIPELITHKANGLLVTPGNIKELTQSLKLLIEDEELRATLGSAALISIKPFNINQYCDSLIRLYCFTCQRKTS
jgi:glycosyltransferase involved in cell wall biosynthesis